VIVREACRTRVVGEMRKSDWRVIGDHRAGHDAAQRGNLEATTKWFEDDEEPHASQPRCDQQGVDSD